MDIYIFDITTVKENLTETQEYLADNIKLYNNMFRGYTTNRFVMMKYIDYMEWLIGKYINFEVFGFEIPDELTDDEINKAAIKIRNTMFPKNFPKVVSCSEITITRLDNDGYELVCNDELMEFSSSVDYNWQPNNDILKVLMFLFTDTIKYIPSMNNNPKIIELRQFLLDGLRERIRDFYDQDDGIYRFDLLAIVKYYIDSKLFLGVKDI